MAVNEPVVALASRPVSIQSRPNSECPHKSGSASFIAMTRPPVARMNSTQTILSTEIWAEVVA